MPNFGAPLWVVLSPPHCPDKKQLIDVKDFFKYTEEAGQPAVQTLHSGYCTAFAPAVMTLKLTYFRQVQVILLHQRLLRYLESDVRAPCSGMCKRRHKQF